MSNAMHESDESLVDQPSPESDLEALQTKIVRALEGKVVRKDLTQLVKGNAVVPTYVLEYLLGQYCPTDDEDLIRNGVEKVRQIVRNHYVHRDEAELVKSTIRQQKEHKIIDRVSVQLNENRDIYVAAFSNLGIRGVEVSEEVIEQHPKLLTSGVWCIVDMAYLHTEEARRSPWIIERLKPIQMGSFDVQDYRASRSQFTTDEWLDLLIQSIGLNPATLSRRNKLYQLVRLIPFCERNYNLIELGPKGTGKSHIYSEFSPHGILISGGDVTKAKLFVNNNTGDIGLVGYWDVVGFDEFAGQDKRVSRGLVDIMKNYMANRSFSRGRDTMSAEASMAFIGNTDRSVPYMIKHSNLFEPLPKGYYDPAFIDRLHFYVPGWEVDKLRNEMFTDGYGLIVDYLAEALHTLRGEDFSLMAREHFELDASLTKRDRDGTMKTLSGLLKLLYPNKQCPKDEMKRLLEFAMEGRKRVKEHLLRIDETFEVVDFQFSDRESGTVTAVDTLEFRQHQKLVAAYESDADRATGTSALVPDLPTKPDGESEEAAPVLESGTQVEVMENQKGISYETLFAPYLREATKIEIIDPYVRAYHQVKNVMEFCDMLLRTRPEGDEVDVHLITGADTDNQDEQEQFLDELSDSLAGTGVRFTYEISWESMHARSIKTDTGWKISLDRGLDIFQPPTNRFDRGRVNQKARRCKPFEVTYLRDEDVSLQKG
ncbi:BREX system Lon protease-like protein BrxL [Longimonas halophila]|uniref:BREX system Lon protease-like protein BrxL n=1 Tax=Longimonas halophila TaxID=1469170 RepID=A0A2H3P943_9BACT|nr:BREX system Lon protease-like protein BrxL [Longimonas halophila]PEN09425.1 BREX system Lon protease-like protein BrxL [Longimonas halophila]